MGVGAMGVGNAERPIGIGVVGLNFGLGRCATIREVEEARLVAVAARTEATARRAGDHLGVAWYTDYQAMLRRDDLDVVAVYTPSALHGEIAAAAARAGKHVLTTKPLDITLDRVDATIATCRAAGVKLATEYVTRYGPSYYRAYRAIADGLLGRPILGEFSYKCYRPPSYYQGTRGTWAMDGGGAMMMQAIHVIDLMLWYLGPARTVTARATAAVHRLEAEDTAVALVTFANGAMATLVGTTTFHNDRPPGGYGGGTIIRVEVGGERGSLIMSDGTPLMWQAEAATEPPADLPPARNAFQDVARWARDDAYRSPTLVPGTEARRSVELVLALYESARTGQTVTLPTAAE
jgi:UDP-N-acetyl-2-amino-2-deoxyglucuronate dehydrogenase